MEREGFDYQVAARDGEARTGVFTTPHGAVETPAFMPVGTAAAVKSLTPDEVWGSGARMILANTYHLMLRPGEGLVARAGGLHSFQSWPGAILTDSGGYQVFSLAARRKIDDDGVTFSSHIDGSSHRLTPERTMEIEQALGADVAMALDECPPGGAPRAEIEKAVRRTSAWARRCLRAHRRPDQALFGIVQGGTSLDLRMAHAAELSAMGFDGMALGGLSVGEPPEEMSQVVEKVTPTLPADRPRYLMGVGTEADILEGISAGVDLFDCVLPTRNGRNGQVFTSMGRLVIKNARYLEDPRPLDEHCSCYACRTFDRRYLRHLYITGDILVHRLLSLHNLHHYGELMAGARAAIRAGELQTYRQRVVASVMRRLPDEA
jgi:queuine tRNA-ribosyltransferase